MAFDLKVHHFEKKGPNSYAMTRVTPYCRMTNPNTGVKVFIRSGKAWDASGNRISPTPSWCLDRLKTMNPEVVRECGFGYLFPEKPVDKESPLENRLRISVEKGLLSAEEYERLVGKSFGTADDTSFGDGYLAEGENVTTEVTGDDDVPHETLDNEKILAGTTPATDVPDNSIGVPFDYSALSRPELMGLCRERGVPVERKDTVDSLVAKLNG